MKTIYVKFFFVISLIFFILCLHYTDQLTYFKPHYQQKSYEVTVTSQEGTSQIALDDYLVGVVAGEMPVSFELEALKAQVVASRTFVLSRNLKVDNTTLSQVYLTKEQMKKNWGNQYEENYQKIQKAVQETNNEVMMYQGEYISALFFSSSNGKTSNSEDYFPGKVAYLKSVDSHWDVEIDPQNIRSQFVSKAQLAKAFGISVSNMTIASHTESGYVKKVVVNGKEYSGREVREKLGLASSCFEMKREEGGYRFTTKGNGHGVGMSQYGAQAMAKENKNYKEILNHYYQNIEIKSIDL